ncbi:MAG: LmeA family phospholipid-binding protein [Fretibacterium sp.]|nr:LmeA family phospholipid-binding protein [Fretibacterium sp.]
MRGFFRNVGIFALFFLPVFCFPAWGADFEFNGKIEPADDVSHLLAFYVNRFTPEELKLTVSGHPDATGRFAELYMDLTGVMIENVRLDKLTFRMYGVQFNSPENWASGNVECRDALQIHALGTILQSDINKSLEVKTFGDDDHWRKVSLAITPGGLRGKGYYIAKVLFVTLDILIEIDSGLKIVKNKELWLDNPEVRINRLDLPEYITNKALSQIQPLLNLNRFPLPMSLHKVTLEEGRAILSTRQLPKPMEKGISYHYVR